LTDVNHWLHCCANTTAKGIAAEQWHGGDLPLATGEKKLSDCCLQIPKGEALNAWREELFARHGLPSAPPRTTSQHMTHDNGRAAYSSLTPVSLISLV
jgi:hypothetical protein